MAGGTSVSDTPPLWSLHLVPQDQEIKQESSDPGWEPEMCCSTQPQMRARAGWDMEWDQAGSKPGPESDVC